MSGDAVDHRVSDPFSGEQEESKNRESNLEAFGVEFFLGDRLDAPLSSRFIAETTSFPNHVEIDERSQKCKNHHRDTDSVLMEAVGRSVNARGGGKSAEADGDAKAADGDDGRAGTLENGKNEAGPGGKRDIEYEHPRRMNRRTGLWDICGVLDRISHILL